MMGSGDAIVLRYGADENQFGELRMPAGSGPFPALIVIHGGFWRAARDLTYIRPFCRGVTALGIVTFSVEYRRSGDAGGGWPGTLDDIRAAGAFFGVNAGLYGIEMERVAVAGHSAGGQLALWLAGERALPLRGAVSLAGVVDLRRGWRMRLGNGAVGDLIGGSPEEYPERYRAASPIERLPLNVPARLIHGADDPAVPLELAEAYVAAACAAGDDARLEALAGVGHSELVDPEAAGFAVIRRALMELLG